MVTSIQIILEVIQFLSIELSQGQRAGNLFNGEIQKYRQRLVFIFLSRSERQTGSQFCRLTSGYCRLLLLLAVNSGKFAKTPSQIILFHLHLVLFLIKKWVTKRCPPPSNFSYRDQESWGSLLPASEGNELLQTPSSKMTSEGKWE